MQEQLCECLSLDLGLSAAAVCAMQCTEDMLVNAANVDPFLRQRSVAHLWSHMLHLHAPPDGSSLGKKGYDLIFDALSKPSTALVLWVTAGHEVRQEAKRPLLDLLDVLANPCPQDYGVSGPGLGADPLLRLAPPADMVRQLRAQEEAAAQASKAIEDGDKQEEAAPTDMEVAVEPSETAVLGETAIAQATETSVLDPEATVVDPQGDGHLMHTAAATGSRTVMGHGVGSSLASTLPALRDAPQVPPVDDVSRQLLHPASPRHASSPGRLASPKRMADTTVEAGKGEVASPKAKADVTVSVPPAHESHSLPSPKVPPTAAAPGGEAPGSGAAPGLDKGAAFAAQAALAQTGGDLDVTQQARPNSAPIGVLDRYVPRFKHVDREA